MEESLVCIVMLNWNGFKDTDECLNSVEQQSHRNSRIIVVDNASSDDSPLRIARKHPRVHLVQCAENRGIAAGYNKGMLEALALKADYIVLMNNDVVCDRNFVEKMLEAPKGYQQCGIVVPKIYYWQEPDVIWSAGAVARGLSTNIVLRGRGRRDGGNYNRRVKLDFAPSCCLLLTRAVSEQLCFDEKFFFYFDDWDFCLRARKLGFDLVFAPDSHIWHKVSQSTMNSSTPSRWWRVLGQSCVRYHRKHHSLSTLLAYLTWVVAREISKGNLRNLPSFLGGAAQSLRMPL